MSKFNPTKIKSETLRKTTNQAGGVAYTMSDKMELYTTVCNALLENQFYEKADDKLARISSLIKKCPPEFVAKLAIYARTKMNLRSVPIVMLCELARIHTGDNLVSKALSLTINRADELAETLSYYITMNGNKTLGKLSKQIYKGLAIAFNKFDEYNLAKYNRDSKAVKLVDVLRLVHPKAKTEEQQVIFTKLYKDELAVPYTWETELSKAGQSGKEKKQVWEELINSGKVGYMALLRNLRNILEAKVSNAHLEKVYNILSNADQVAKAKQFPFRFLSAWKELSDINSGLSGFLKESLSTAMEHSAKNIQGFGLDTKVCIAVDTSGSMGDPLSAKSKLKYYEVGMTLACLLRHVCKNVTMTIFGDSMDKVEVPKGNIISNIDSMRSLQGRVGHSTNGHLVLQWLIQENIEMDKVFYFSDMALWNSSNNYFGFNPASLMSAWQTYSKMYPNAKLYLINLAGNGTTPVDLNKKNVYMIAGWSDKIFDVLAGLEKGENALSEVEKIDLDYKAPIAKERKYVKIESKKEGLISSKKSNQIEPIKMFSV